MPAAYGFWDVLVKGFVDQVVILCGGVVVAQEYHRAGQQRGLCRSFAGGSVTFCCGVVDRGTGQPTLWFP